MTFAAFGLDGLSRAAWRDSAIALLLGTIAILILFRDTAATAVALWSHTSAYNYAYLIVPISAYVAWIDRARLVGLAPRPTWWGLAVAFGAALLWMAADLVGIDEGRHFALVGLLEGLFLGVLGVEVFRRMLFPLLYLFLLVPSGDMLLGWLQRVSHFGSVILVRASGIPTFAEGMYIEVPHGHFLVEPGCAGLNFFLASLALALLYGKLTYGTTRARVFCVAIALVTSVIANILRIYLIVGITEWSHRRIDIADDHLLYGWGFFAVVMLAMMRFGQRFAAPEELPVAPPATSTAAPPPRLGWIASVAAAVVAIAAAPVALAALENDSHAGDTLRIALPHAFNEWPSGGIEIGRWRPGFVPGDADALASYDVDHHRVDLVVIGYRAQRDGREAATAGNMPADGKAWEEIERRSHTTVIDGHPVAATEAVVRAGNASRLVLTWYVSGDCVTASRLIAKLCSARERIRGRPSPGAYFAVATDLTDSREAALRVLTEVIAKIDVPAVLTAEIASPQPIQSPGAG